MYVRPCMYVCMYTYVCMYMYVHMYTYLCSVPGCDQILQVLLTRHFRMTSMPCMSKSFSPFSFLINVITCTVRLWLSNSRLSELLKSVHVQLINFKMAAIIIIIFVSVLTTLCYGLFTVERMLHCWLSVYMYFRVAVIRIECQELYLQALPVTIKGITFFCCLVQKHKNLYPQTLIT